MKHEGEHTAHGSLLAMRVASAPNIKAVLAADWLAACIIVAATLVASLAQYEVDYEVTLLPWLISRGWVMYRDIVDQHTPLLPTLLAPGGGDPGPLLHALVALQHLTLLCLTYVLARRLFGWAAGLFSLALVEVWSVAFDSMRLWYDSVLGLIYLVVLLVITSEKTEPAQPQERSDADRRLLYQSLAAGVLMSVAVLIKQHALIAVPFVVATIVWRSRPSWTRALIGFTMGVAVPLATAAILLFTNGALNAGWYWTVEYSLTSNYVRAAALPPGRGEWWKFAAFFLPAVAAAMLLIIRRGCPLGGGDLRASVLITLVGFLLAGSLPAWPRYGAFHLQALVPVVCILAGFVFFRVVHTWRSGRIKHSFATATALALLGVCALVGAGEWVRAIQTSLYLGPARAPYADSITPLREWVATHGAGSPVFIYGLDPLLYRALEVIPPRPWAPQLPWILEAQPTEADLWAGVERARPLVALAPASAWDSSPLAGPEYGVPRLRQEYREAGRFRIAIYKQSPAVNVVGLLRSDGSRR